LAHRGKGRASWVIGFGSGRARGGLHMAAANGGTNGHANAGDDRLRKILGKERFEKVSASKLLVVGAGGIGCELLKNLVLTGFKDIEVIDLDTIDVSNLNRQFLFRRAHVDRPKAEVASEAVRNWSPGVKIVAHHGNVKESQYGVEYFSKFDAVVNALDNLEARRHVNRLCLAAEKPLLEAGSTGHLGQVTVIKKGETECFECQSKPTQKVYPYCTIRSTPEKPIHCLVWAKNLFDLCFGPEDESNLLSDLLKDVKEMQGEGGAPDGEQIGKKIFGHLFDDDIRKQAALEDLWSDERPPPTPLPFDEASKQTTAAKDDKASEKLVAQRVPAVSGDATGFVAAVAKMYSPERAAGLGSSVFSKDDAVSMDFVHCAANLRMENYRISRLSRWDAQSIAGAIIPAVASTNAIVAGLEVVQLIHVLAATPAHPADPAAEAAPGSCGSCLRKSAARTVWVRYPEPSRKKILQPSTLQVPNKECLVCGSRTARVYLKGLSDWKICAFVKACVQGSLGAHRPAVYYNGSCIFDPEYPEASEEATEEGLHPEWTLAEWGLISGNILQVEDEGQGFSCNLVIQEDADLCEKLFPAGFNIQGGSEPPEDKEAAAEAKRKAEEALEAETAKKAKLAADSIALDD